MRKDVFRGALKDYLPDLALGSAALAFAAGVACGGMLDIGIPPQVALALQAIAAAAYMGVVVRKGRLRQSNLEIEAEEIKRISNSLSRYLVVLFFCIGFLQIFGASWPLEGKALPDGFTISSKGVVEEIRELPESTYQGPRYQAVIRLLDHVTDVPSDPDARTWQRQRKILLTIRFDRGQAGEAMGKEFGQKALAGVVISFSGEIRKGEGPRNPGEFDYNRYLRTKGIYCRGDAEGTAVYIEREPSLFQRAFSGIRSGLTSQAEQALGPKEAAVIAGCLLGDQTLMEREDIEIYRKVGIAHLFAVSGTHGGIILAFVLQMERYGPFRTRKKTARVIALGFLFFYLNLTGFPLSMQRTFLMACVMQGAVLIDRKGDAFNAFAAAVLFLLWLYPQSLFGAGFQLSFGVTLGIIHLETWLRKRLPTWLAVSVAAQLAAMPIQAYWFYQIQPAGFLINVWAVALTPPLLILSGIAGLIGVWNPAVAAILWQAPGLLAAVLDRSAYMWSSLPFATYNIREYPWPAYILWGLLLWLLPGLKAKEAAMDQWFFQKHQQKKRQSDWEQWEAWRSAKHALIVARQNGKVDSGRRGTDSEEMRSSTAGYRSMEYQGGESHDDGSRVAEPQNRGSKIAESHGGESRADGLPPVFKPAEAKPDPAWLIWRNRKKIGIVSVAVCLALIFLTQKPLRICFLDVGQGDGAVFITPSGNVWMADGGSSNVSRLAAYRLEPFLRSQGVNRLDYLLVSHADEDHISGIKELLSAGWPVGCLILSPQAANEESGMGLVALAEENGAEVVLLCRGYTVQDGEVYLRCLYPEVTASHQAINESSLVTELSYREFSMLLTGDIDSKTEEALRGHWPAANL
ncbi:MAG: ComEC/Rec2 family competence protein, partial [Peptococcaceae bacterium]|nr:ComEC/Rec2 family competence protein [Peptococcaceae bacterium]